MTGKMGAQSNPMLSFTCEAHGSGGGSPTPKLDPLLAVVLGPGNPDTGSTTVQAGSAPGANNTYVVNVASASNFTIGNAVAIETGSPSNVWEAGWIVNVDNVSGQKTITISRSPSFTLPPAAGARVYSSTTYRPRNSGHGSLTFRMYLDSTSYIAFYGCKGSLKFDAPAPGAVPTITFNWKAMSWAHVDSVTRPTPTWDAATAPTPYLFRLDATSSSVKLASWDLRQAVAKKRSQNSASGTIAELVTDRDLRGYIQTYDVDESQFYDPNDATKGWKGGQEQELSHQFGSTQYNMVAYQIQKAQRTRVGYGDDNGLTTDTISFEGNIASGEDEVRLAFL